MDLLQKIKLSEEQDLIATDQYQFRILQSVTNQLETLSIMLDYIKDFPICNPCQNPTKRLIPELISMKTDNNDTLNSQLITVNSPYIDSVKQLCILKGLTYTVVKPKDLKNIQVVELSQRREQIQQYFNQYQIYICSNTVLNPLKKLINGKYSFKYTKDEYQTVDQIYKELKTLQQSANDINPQQFLLRMQQLVTQLPSFIDQQECMKRFYNTGDVIIHEIESLHFQRTIYIETHSSKCKILIPSKCSWILNHIPDNLIPVNDIQRAYQRTQRITYLCGVSVKKYIEIDILHQQMIDFINTNINRFILPEQTSEFKTQISHQLEQELFNSIPQRGVQDISSIPSMIYQMPFKIYNINDPDSVTLSSVTQQESLIQIIKQRHQEQCPICMEDTREFFTFGCCGCSISVECLNKLICDYNIKCPNCRHTIRSNNIGFGAFFLDKLFVSKPIDSVDKLHNTTIIMYAGICKIPSFKSDDKVHNIIIKPYSETSPNTFLVYLYNVIKQTPEHMKLKIFLNGSLSQISRISQQLIIQKE